VFFCNGKRLNILGILLLEKGVATDPSKIETIKTWSVTKTITQLRGFLGLAGYYRMFVKDYGLICRPLHGLLKKDSFQWTSEHIVAFDLIKENMTTTHVFALPNFHMPFTLETDGLGFGFGAVLMQNGQAIAFYSQALGPKAAAQSTYHKEAIGILQALRKWRHYLLGGNRSRQINRASDI
jgi:hypothetical protein